MRVLLYLFVVGLLGYVSDCLPKRPRKGIYMCGTPAYAFSRITFRISSPLAVLLEYYTHYDLETAHLLINAVSRNNHHKFDYSYEVLPGVRSNGILN